MVTWRSVLKPNYSENNLSELSVIQRESNPEYRLKAPATELSRNKLGSYVFWKVYILSNST